MHTLVRCSSFRRPEINLSFVSTGHAMWPAVVVDESNVPANRALKPGRLDQSILVQFFGTHDFARFDSVKGYLR